MLEPSNAVILGLGFLLGLRHATDADHIAAVTTFVGEQQRLLHGCWIGVFWGIGHTLALLAAGAVVVMMRVPVSGWLAARLELAVAAMLVFLGGRLLLKSSRKRIAVHKHEHAHGGPGAGTVHTHWHVHAVGPRQAQSHTHSDWMHFGFKPLLVGLVHGAAGSAALAVLVLSTIASPLQALLYIVIFGVGSIAGMLAISFLLTLPFYWARDRGAAVRPLQMAAGLFSCLFGFYLAADVLLSPDF